MYVPRRMVGAKVIQRRARDRRTLNAAWLHDPQNRRAIWSREQREIYSMCGRVDDYGVSMFPRMGLTNRLDSRLLDVKHSQVAALRSYIEPTGTGINAK